MLLAKRPAGLLAHMLLPICAGLSGCESFDPLNVVRVVKVEIINMEKAPDAAVVSMAAMESTNTWNPRTPNVMDAKWEAVDVPMTGERSRETDVGGPWQGLRCRDIDRKPRDGADVKRQECILEAPLYSTVTLKATTKSSDTSAMWSFKWDDCPNTTAADEPICTIQMDRDRTLSLTIKKKAWNETTG